jgi:hypothetical protein
MYLMWLYTECCRLVHVAVEVLWSRGKEKADMTRSRGRMWPPIITNLRTEHYCATRGFYVTPFTGSN